MNLDFTYNLLMFLIKSLYRFDYFSQLTITLNLINYSFIGLQLKNLIFLYFLLFIKLRY
jgi:hypothetical protein